MFGQDCDSVREFCSLNVVNHFVSETQKGAKFFVVVNGVLDPSTPQSGGQTRSAVSAYLCGLCVKTALFYAENAEIRRGPLRKQAPINLTVIYAMADNNGLFLGVPGTSPS